MPLGILLAMKLIPPEILVRLRDEAMAMSGRPTSRLGLAAIIVIWIAAGALLLKLLLPRA